MITITDQDLTAWTAAEYAAIYSADANFAISLERLQDFQSLTREERRQLAAADLAVAA